MTRLQTVRAVVVVVVALVLLVASAVPVFAQEDECQPWEFTFPAGASGAGFDLQVNGCSGGSHWVVREFFDKDGNLVRSLSAGIGSPLTFTNATTGKNLSTMPNGAVSHIAYNSDGSYTEKDTGHNVLILAPTDVPPGPSTTLYVGQIVFKVDVDPGHARPGPFAARKSPHLQEVYLAEPPVATPARSHTAASAPRGDARWDRRNTHPARRDWC